MRDRKETYIGYVEMALGVGDVVGPAIGGLMFGIIGFQGTFLAFGSMIALGIVLSIKWIPSSLNKQDHDEHQNQRSVSLGYEELTYRKIFF